VLALTRRHKGARGVRRPTAALSLMDPGAQSPKETWLRLLLIDAGFPPPATQIPVHNGDLPPAQRSPTPPRQQAKGTNSP